MVLSESKILIVDDDASIRRLLVRFLSQYSYQIKEADSGHQALAIFAEFQPNLVILDINLPDSLGYHICEQMQSRTNVLILMLTSAIVPMFYFRKRGWLQ
jgi:DNA-binding response OmpR family regulator